MKILFFILSILVISNIITLVLFIHSRHSYRKLMQKSLRQDDECNNLVEPIVFEATDSIDDLSEKLLQKLQTSMEKGKLYLRPELNIQDLAKELGTNKTTLSHVINACLHQNFSSLLNSYRIKESLSLLSDPQYFQEKMEVIGEMCGYSNRQVFHKAFKKEMGITPSHFRNIQKATVREK
ncbi:MAG: helix-turn-helix transcriptional regulator [Bacteroidales bacterium]|nr:helix-turn-helix transcriptional regulator [Bacteroidales bacterium]